MDLASFVFGYVTWHYGRASRDIAVVGRNLLWFITHFFSIPLLFRTMFEPWKRIHDSYGRRSLEDFFATLVMNIMTRFVGALIRISIIAVGALFLLAGLSGLIAFYALWFGAPFFIPAMFLYGSALLFI